MRFLVASLLAFAASGIALAPGSQREPVLVGGDVRKPRRTVFVQPEYPPEAEAAGLQSLVILELTVDARGNVFAARALRGAPTVVPAALDAARQWKYEPTLVDGEAVPVRFSETVIFVLRDRGPARVGGHGMYLRPASPGATSDSYEDWLVEGEAVTACPCDTPCPCRSNAPPSHPPCHATTAQRFSRGYYGSVDLAGVSYVTLGPESWTAIYFDDSVTREQEQAVLDIYASLAPGAPQVYRSVRSVPLRYETSDGGRHKRVEIPGILEMASRARTDPASLVLGMDVWSNRLRYGDTGTYRYRDDELGEAWDHSGRQSNHKSFVARKSLYDNGEMLIQHGDGSGRWTERQRRILACLR